MMKVEGQQVERENRGTVGAEDREGEVLGRGLRSLFRFFFNFLFRYAAFWVQSDAFSDITRPVPNSLHSQPAESSDKKLSLSLPVPHWVRDAGHILNDFSLVGKRG